MTETKKKESDVNQEGLKEEKNFVKQKPFNLKETLSSKKKLVSIISACAAAFISITTIIINTVDVASIFSNHPSGIKPYQISFDQQPIISEVGLTYNMKYTIMPDNANPEFINWSSSDDSIATVNSVGHIEFVGSGVVTIKADTTEGIFDEHKFYVSDKEYGLNDLYVNYTTINKKFTDHHEIILDAYIENDLYKSVVKHGRFHVKMSYLDTCVFEDDFDAEEIYKKGSHWIEVYYDNMEPVYYGISNKKNELPTEINIDVYDDRDTSTPLSSIQYKTEVKIPRKTLKLPNVK